jgi:hypothetical protein
MPTDAYVSNNGQRRSVKLIFYRLASVGGIELTIENYLKLKFVKSGRYDKLLQNRDEFGV